MLHLVQRCRPPTPPAHEKVRTNKVLQLHSASPPFPLNDSGKQRESREKWRRRTTRGQSWQSSEVGARPGARAQAQTQSHPAARTWPCRPGGAREEWLPWPGVKIMRENRKMDGYRLHEEREVKPWRAESTGTNRWMAAPLPPSAGEGWTRSKADEVRPIFG